MAETMRLVEVPLDRLKISDENVRKAPPDERGVQRLAALIKAQGLLQPLLVESLAAGGGRKEPDWIVTGGGRRLAAMRRLAAEGAWESDALVPCVELCGSALVLSGEEASLGENSGREDLHPVDQAVAFRQLRDECGLTDNDLAVRFRVSPRTVQRRLRVASVAPELLAKARAGEIRLGMLEAASVSDDHAVQLEAVRKHGDKWNAESEVRQALLAGKLLDYDDLVHFVGLERYRAAGGATQPDLFGRTDEIAWAEGNEPDPEREDEPAELLADVKLLRRLAKEKLDSKAAAERRKGWPDVRGRFEEPHGWHAKYKALSVDKPGDLAKGKAEREALLKASIVWLWVGYGGEFETLRAVERSALDRVAAERDRREAHERAVKAAEEAGTEAPKEPEPELESESLELPASLLADLRMMRADVQRRYLIDRPELARDILLFALCRRIYGEARHYDSGLSVSAGSVPRTALEALGEDRVPDAVKISNALLAKREEALLGWAGEEAEPGSDEWARAGEFEAERFQRLRAMDERDKAELLACCVARTLEPVAGDGLGAHQADRALAELGIDWHLAFNPGKPVLARLTRAQLLAIADGLGEADRDAMGPLGGLKKAELLEAVLIGMASYRARERREPWLPSEVFGEPSPNGEAAEGKT